MTKGSYEIGDDSTPPPRRDTSYRSFICALLVFLCICLIILLATINWRSGKDKPEVNNGSETSAHKVGEELTEDVDKHKAKSNKTHEKIEEYDRRTTERNRLIDISETMEDFEENFKSTTERSKNGGVLFTSEKIFSRIDSSTTEETFQSTSDNNEDKKSIVDDLEESSQITTTTEEDVQTTLKLQLSTTKDDSEEETGSQAEGQRTTLLEFQESSSRIPENTSESDLEEEKSSLFGKSELQVTSTESENETTTVLPETSSEIVLGFHSDSRNTSSTTKDNTVLITSTESDQQLLAKLPTESPDDLTTTESSTDSSEDLPQFAPLIMTTQTSTTTEEEISIMESEAVTDPVIPKTTSSKKTFDPVCRTPICKTLSSRILSMMNHSVEPCDNFYEFACGNAYEIKDFTEEQILQEQLQGVNASGPNFASVFKNFYESCLDHENYFNYGKRMRGLEDIVEEVGQFHFNISAEIDLTDLVSKLLLRQSMPLFDIGLDIDKQSSNFILQLNLPHQSFLGTGIENWSGLSLLKGRCLEEQKSRLHGSYINLTEIYDVFRDCQKDFSSYLNSVETVLRDMTVFSSLTEDSLLQEIKFIRFAIEFEVLDNLATLPPPATILSNFISKNYDVRRVSDLQIHFPIFNWTKLLETVTGRPIDSSTTIQVYFADYFKNVFTKLANVDKRKLNNAFLSIFSYDLFINTVIPKENSNRNSFCEDLSKKLLPDVWRYFVQSSEVLQKQKSQQVTDLFEELKKNFCNSLNEADWIDDNTRVGIMKKCNELNMVLFDPSKPSSFDIKYDGLNITNNYQKNLMVLLSNYKQMVYSVVGTPLSADTIFNYFLNPMSKKPLTFYANPMIVVPLGLLERAHIGLPNYLFKTRVGFSLARQIVRHFDPTGMTYKVRLTSTSKFTYNELVHIMENLMDYSSPRVFQNKNISFVLNGSLSIHERIVDNTAFRLIYDSLNLTGGENILPWISLQYASDKVFFIATAQELCKKTSMLDFMLQVFEKRHLPAVLRVENIVGNSKEFISKFSCPTGSGMDFYEKLQFPFLETVEYEDEENLSESK